MYQRVWLKSNLVIISILIIIVKFLLSVNWFELEHEFQTVVKSGRPMCHPDFIIHRHYPSIGSEHQVSYVGCHLPRPSAPRYFACWHLSISPYVSHRQQYKHNHAVCSIEVILIAVYETNYGFHIGDFEKFDPVLFVPSSTVQRLLHT